MGFVLWTALRAPGLELSPSRPGSRQWPAPPRGTSNLQELELVRALSAALRRSRAGL